MLISRAVTKTPKESQPCSVKQTMNGETRYADQILHARKFFPREPRIGLSLRKFQIIKGSRNQGKITVLERSNFCMVCMLF